MAHYVAKVLKIRPNEIMDNWNVAELIVAYGQYANEESYKNYLEWKSLPIESKNKIKQPKMYQIKFINITMEEGDS